MSRARGSRRPLTARHGYRVLGAVLGGLVLVLVAAAAKNAIVAAKIRRVNEHGGMVIGYSEPFPLWSRLPAGARWWIREHYVIRDAYFVAFDLHAAPCPVGETLRAFPEREVSVGDPALAAVKDLGRVRWLTLHDTAVSDAGLAALRDLRMLERLDLQGTRATGPGLAHLRGLPLTELFLGRTPIDDAGLAYLDELPQLRSLWIGGTRIVGPGLARLGRFGKLRSLNLDDTAVDDGSLRFLAGLQVSTLYLSGTAVSDAGLEDLVRMPLNYVTLCETRVTAAAVARTRFETRGPCP